MTIPAGHALDALCYLLGEFSHLSATTAHHYPTYTLAPPADSSSTAATTHQRTAPDSFSLFGSLQSGASVNFHMYATTPVLPDTIEWTIVGEKGSLRLEGDSFMVQMVPMRLWRSGEAKKWERVEVEDVDAVAAEYAAFAAGAGGANVMDFEGAVLRHRMLDAVWRSVKEGRSESYM